MIHKLGFCWCGTAHARLSDASRPPPPAIDWETKAAENISMWQEIKTIIRVVIQGRHDI
jgi:hypothetical protein